MSSANNLGADSENLLSDSLTRRSSQADFRNETTQESHNSNPEDVPQALVETIEAPLAVLLITPGTEQALALAMEIAPYFWMD
jgi:hypothetical protein